MATKPVVVSDRPALTQALDRLRAAVNVVLDFADSAADRLTKAFQARS